MAQVAYGERHGWTIARISGDLEVTAVAAVRERLAALIWSGCRRLILDLTALEFCDSLGFGAMIATKRQMADKQGRLRLVLPQEGSVARKALVACGIDRAFTVFEQAADAIADER